MALKKKVNLPTSVTATTGQGVEEARGLPGGAHTAMKYISDTQR